MQISVEKKSSFLINYNFAGTNFLYDFQFITMAYIKKLLSIILIIIDYVGYVPTIVKLIKHNKNVLGNV